MISQPSKQIIKKALSQFDFWKLTVDDVQQLGQWCVDICVQSKRELLSISDSKKTFSNTVELFAEHMLGDARSLPNRLNFLSLVHPDPDMVIVLREVVEYIEKQALELFRDKDIYTLMMSCANIVPADDQSQKLYKDMMIGFEREGYHLSDSQQNKILAIQKQLVEISTEFEANIANSRVSVPAKEKDVDGLPAALISTFSKNEKDEYLIPTDTAVMVQVSSYSKSRDFRIRYNKVYDARGGKRNLLLLQKASVLRAKLVKLLGYKSFEQYVVADTMALTPDRVTLMLDNLVRGFTDIYNTYEYPGIEKLKDDYAELFVRVDTEPHFAALASQYGVDPNSEEVRGYFALDNVLSVMHDTFSKVLGLTFQYEQKKMWNKDIKVVKVSDTKKNKDIGYLIYDLHPRDGKYSHACAAPIAGSDKDVLPTIAMVANMTKDKSGQALLGFNEVTTMFHEFGHLMHFILSHSAVRYASQNGFAASIDFVEMPSQLFEEWASCDIVLSKMAIHCKTGAVMPKSMRKKLVLSKYIGAGYAYLRQCAFVSLDRYLHADTEKVAHIEKKYAGIVFSHLNLRPIPGSLFPASFGHMMSGYGGQYYSYLWSLSIVKDMWSRFEKPFDTKRCSALKQLLCKGSSVDEAELVSTFLGGQEADFTRLPKQAGDACVQIYGSNA